MINPWCAARLIMHYIIEIDTPQGFVINFWEYIKVSLSKVVKRAFLEIWQSISKLFAWAVNKNNNFYTNVISVYRATPFTTNKRILNFYIKLLIPLSFKFNFSHLIWEYNTWIFNYKCFWCKITHKRIILFGRIFKL